MSSEKHFYLLVLLVGPESPTFLARFHALVTLTMPVLSDMPYQEMPPIHIIINGIVQLLQNLKPSKAPGPDKIPTSLLKELDLSLHLV